MPQSISSAEADLTAASLTPQAARALLRRVGLRATRARVDVIRLLQRRAVPRSHDQVYREVGPDNSDRATIYRVLLDLVRVGVVRRFDPGDCLWRFELALGGEPTHPHFVCRGCGSVSCLPRGSIAVNTLQLAEASLPPEGLEIQVRGVCADCAAGRTDPHTGPDPQPVAGYSDSSPPDRDRLGQSQ